MVVADCSCTPGLVLVLSEELEPLSKGQCLFLGRPNPV